MYQIFETEASFFFGIYGGLDRLSEKSSEGKMIDPKSPISWLTCESSLIARCLLSGKPKTVIKNALHLSRTAKIYKSIINSDLFFRTVIQLIDPSHPLFIPTEKKAREDKASKPFRQLFFETRNHILKKHESFSVTDIGSVMCEAMTSKKGMEVVAVFNDIVSFKLENNLQVTGIEIPEYMRLPNWEVMQMPPCLARSERFLAVNTGRNSAIYIYTPDGKQCMARYVVTGTIYQIEIHSNLLCIAERHIEGNCNLVVMDLDASQEETPLTLSLPNYQYICFGKEYFICIKNTLANQSQLWTLPLSRLHDKSLALVSPVPWLTVPVPLPGSNYHLFPDGSDFIEVTFNDPHKCEITKLTITQESFLRTPVAKDVVISRNAPTTKSFDVCFHDNRLIIAYYFSENKTQIFSYDLLSKQTTDLFTIHDVKFNYRPYKARFFNVARTIYFLVINSERLNGNQFQVRSNLVTFTFGI